MIYQNPQTETEAEELLEHLKNIHGGDLKPVECDALRAVFVETTYPGLRDLIGRTLVEAADEDLYPLLIQKLKENIHTDHIGHLIGCCTSYECSDDLQLFIDIVILKSGISVFGAIDVISNMKYIDENERVDAINKLVAYRDTLDKSHIKYESVEDLVLFLESE